MLAALIAFVGLSLPACTTTLPTDGDPVSAAPADFSLDVTVLAQSALHNGVPAEPDPHTLAYQRPSRYVMLADGTLCHDADWDVQRGANGLPPITRILSRRQVAEVWSVAQQLGLADSKAGDPTVNFKLVTARPGECVYVAGFAARGARWNFIRRAPIDQPPDPALAEVVRHLAQLAWVPHQPEAEVFIMPKRYDFGPDPYARYRKR